MTVEDKFDPQLPLTSTINMRGGREIYTEFMVANDEKNKEDDGFTLQERRILHGLFFDETQVELNHDRAVIPDNIYKVAKKGIEVERYQIFMARYNRTLDWLETDQFPADNLNLG